MNVLNTAGRLILCLILTLSYSQVQSQTLKAEAQQKGKYVGNILSINGLDQLMNQNFNFQENNIIRNELNALVLENDMKMSFVLPNPPANPFKIQPSDFANKARMDRFIAYCKTDDSEQLRARGHALIWYNQAPGWLFDAVNGNNGWSAWSTQNIYDFSESYIKAMVNYFGSDIDEWDVFNEAFSDNSSQVWRTGTWYDKVSSGTYNGQQSSRQLFFEMCFKWADEAANNDVMLFYNDYNIEQKGNFKSDNMYSVISTAVANGSPINGVGFQSHLAHEIISNNFMDDVVSRIRELGNLGDDNDGLGGLKVAITELDIHSSNGNLDDQFVQNSYWQMVSKTLAEPNVDELLVWGISDKDSWITAINSGYFGDKTGYLPWNDNYGKNQNPGAYTGIIDGLSGLPNASFPPSGLNMNWRQHGNHGGGNNGGTDEIVSVSASDDAVIGQNSTVSVQYSASQNRDIVVVFQLDSSPWTTYQSVNTQVNSGSGSLNVSVPIPSNTPVSNNAYQYQVFIAPSGGGWNNRLDNTAQTNVDAVAGQGQAIPNGTYYIKKATSNTYVNATGAVGNCNSISNSGSNSSKWIFTHLGNEEYEIYNSQYSNSRLEVPYAETGNQASVATTNWTGNGNHLVWIAVPVGNNFQFIPKHDQQRALDIWEGNPNVVHLWGVNTSNGNQIFQLVSTSSGREETEIAEHDFESSAVKVFPNPAKSRIHLNGTFRPGDRVELLDISGNMIEQIDVFTPTDSISIDLQSTSPGYYLVRYGDLVTKILVRE
ncbi:MAG: endo-1,4-beta-xylanase [bacterium]|nr:endo-1,4-beta-xylanase [bacterium]